MRHNNLFKSYWINIPSTVLGTSMILGGFYGSITNTSSALQYVFGETKLEIDSNSDYYRLSSQVDRIDDLLDDNWKKIKEKPDSNQFFLREIYNLNNKKSTILTSDNYKKAEQEIVNEHKEKQEDGSPLYYFLGSFATLLLGAVPLSKGLEGLDDRRGED